MGRSGRGCVYLRFMKVKILHFDRYKVLLFLVLAAGFAVRLVYTGSFPANGTVNQDEAYNAYDAWSLLHYGVDSSGYTGAIYSAAWGSGQSIMATLCEMPFIALFGLNSFAVRLPREILGCFGIIAFYFLCKELRGRRAALIGATVISIMPWHIMMCRWGLDANYLPEFLLFAVLFLFKGLDHSAFLILSALFFGLSLYCYVLSWLLIPVFLLICAVFLFVTGQLHFDKNLIFGFFLLVCLAAPLLLFVAVNLNWIAPFRIGFLTIPRLTRFRSNEFIAGFKPVLRNIARNIQMLWQQSDTRLSDVSPVYGIFYSFGWLFVLIGMGASLYEMIALKEHQRDFVIWCMLLCGLGYSVFIEVLFYRINIIFFPLTYFFTLGVDRMVHLFSRRVLVPIAVLFSVSFLGFMSYYVTEYDDALAKGWNDGIGDAVRYAVSSEKDDTTIHVISDIKYSLLLYYAQVPTDEYLRTAQFTYWDDLSSKMAVSFCEFDNAGKLTDENRIHGKNDIYIAYNGDREAMDFMKSEQMELTFFDNVLVGVCQ